MDPNIHMAYYLLHLNLPQDLPADIRALYKEAVLAHNKSIEENAYFDAGFNLICPAEIKVSGGSMVKIDLGVRGAMAFIEKGAALSNPLETGAALSNPTTTLVAGGRNPHPHPVGYFLYPRSSTGTKTPLRLANSLGIIDAGYRGNYIAAFDNIREPVFTVDRLQRLVQICPPNLTYPMRVELVEELEQTERGAGGFGSTGK
jgi:deoxyuridine 5'-triphosphate nucleotidohydrolase